MSLSRHENGRWYIRCKTRFLTVFVYVTSTVLLRCVNYASVILKPSYIDHVKHGFSVFETLDY